MTTTELCARPGCGAPKAWHTTKSTIAELAAWNGMRASHHTIPMVLAIVMDGGCLGCPCAGFLAPEPPKSERTAYVVEIRSDHEHNSFLWHADIQDEAERGYTGFTPLDEYLASHPQPKRPRCICGGEFDDHGELEKCRHVAKCWSLATGVGHLVSRGCECTEYRPVEASA